MLRIAWGESAGLAIQLASRFPSAKLKNEVRWLLLNFPEKALSESAGLEIMFGPALPPDVSFQLKVCPLLLSCLLLSFSCADAP